MESHNDQIKGVVLNFLFETENITAALATVTKDGLPHNSIVYFAAEDDFTIYFLTAVGTRKYNNLLENPGAAFSFGFGPQYLTVQARGHAHLLEKDSSEENHALARLKNRLLENGRTWPVFQLSEHDDDAIATFKFVPTSLTYLNLEPNSQLPRTQEGIYEIL